MIPNIDPETGIHYGIHNANKLDPEVLNDFEIVDHFHCPFCDGDFDNPEEIPEKCPSCERIFEDGDFDSFEAIGGKYEQDGYAIQHTYDSNWVWVFKSPYITHCRECSPCAPHAGDLDAPCESGVPTYCLDSSFFEDEKSPYEYKKRD